MNGYIQIITVFASGVFGLLVAIVTLALTWYKESRAQRRTLTREKKTQREILCADEASIDESKRLP